MNAQQRAPYLAAVEQSQKDHRGGARAGWLILCVMCRHFRVDPPDFDERGCDAECAHPLPAVREGNFLRAWEGGDCWAFAATRRAREEIGHDGRYHTEVSPVVRATPVPERVPGAEEG